MNQKFEEMVSVVLGWYRDELYPDEQEEFKNLSRGELIRYHHTLGTEIRNHFSLWAQPWEPKLIDGFDLSEEHPDAISMRVIEEVWTRIQSK